MTAVPHRDVVPEPAPDMDLGITEVRGSAEDLQAQLFGSGTRPGAEGYTAPEQVSAAVEGARTSIQVHGGGEGAVGVDTAALHTATTAVGRIAGDLGEVLLDLTPLTAELELWALTGQSLLGDAATTAEFLAGDLVGRIAHVGTTVGRLALVALRYEATEHAVLGMFSDTALNSPWYGSGTTLAQETVRTVEALDAALTRADITSPSDFSAKVHFSKFGVVVKDGGPDGTDAVIRGPGLDDVLDTVLQVPLSDPEDAPGAGGDGTGPGGAASSSGGSVGQDGSASPHTLGQYLRGWVVDTLRGYDRQGAPPEMDTALAAVVTAALVRASPLPAFFRPYATGRLLPAAARLDGGLRAALRPKLGPHALHPARREVFTGLTPGNAAAHHMTGLGQRPLPWGVGCDGAVPTTVAGTAAILKDAKNIVSGTGQDGKAVENSTVMVQKATGGDGRAAYSVVLTGTEQWEDGPGVHDVKGIADAMTAPPTAALTELPQAQRMALQALQDAGIRPGDTVVLTGHSLGGIDAAGLAANHEFRRLYDVQAVTTFGAPVGGFAIPDSTSVMAVEHVDDLVPPLDGVPNPDSAHRSTVRVDTPYPDSLEWDTGRGGMAAHEMHFYTLGAQGISAAGHPVVQAHEQRLAAAVPHGSGTRTETFVYEGVEEH